MIKKIIKVLIVDDSMVFRETLSRGISSDPGIEVVATATDPFDARDKILQFEPDVITMDVEMPKMNGIEFLKRLMPQHPVPVIVVSSTNMNIFDALNAGAIDFVAKPDTSSFVNLDGLINELIVKIKIASTSKVGHFKNSLLASNFVNVPPDISKTIIAIGASTGGTEAIYSIIRQFPRNMPGVVIVQHMPPVFTKMYAERLNNSCSMEVKEAETGDSIITGRVLIAQGGFHLKVKKIDNKYGVECIKGDLVNGHCPSVDVLFDSVADQAGKNVIGVILTGMGNDGAKGLLNLRKKGAKTVGQNEESCVVYGMPKVAYDIGAVEKQASLEDIPKLISTILNMR
jgi:two-component system, chemotaxis family, protein-glutamate methylesterase/glutaminase